LPLLWRVWIAGCEIHQHVSNQCESNKRGGNDVSDRSLEEPKKDPHDQAFGSAASHDQDVADALEEAGVTEESLSAEPAREPRAGGKAKPEGE
jgi:hypothetical protein